MHISCHYICFRDAFMYVLHKVFFVTWKQIAENPQTRKKFFTIFYYALNSWLNKIHFNACCIPSMLLEYSWLDLLSFQKACGWPLQKNAWPQKWPGFIFSVFKITAKLKIFFIFISFSLCIYFLFFFQWFWILEL